SGDIATSYSIGNVSGKDHSSVGGLVGQNGDVEAYGTINQSYAIGAVTGGSSSIIGGLVGLNRRPFGTEESEGRITQTYATGLVTAAAGTTNVTAGGLIGL